MARTTAYVLLVALGLLAIANVAFIVIAVRTLSGLRITSAEREYSESPHTPPSSSLS